MRVIAQITTLVINVRTAGLKKPKVWQKIILHSTRSYQYNEEGNGLVIFQPL